MRSDSLVKIITGSNEIELNLINLFDNIDEEKLSTIVKYIPSIDIEDNFDFMNMLFQKFEDLFVKLNALFIRGNKNKCMYIPQTVKKLNIGTPFLFTSKETLNLEILNFMPRHSECDDENTIHNINFESIKEFRLCELVRYLSCIEKMVNLELLDLFNLDDTINIAHLDKLNHFNGYTGFCELPSNMTILSYDVYTIKPIPLRIKRLDLHFNFDIDTFTEFSCDDVVHLSITSSISMKNVYCYFPNVIKLKIVSHDKDFTSRLINTCQNVQRLHIHNVETFDCDLISSLNDLNSLILWGENDHCWICSDSVVYIEIRCITNKIELKTKKLMDFRMTPSNQNTNGIIIQSSQKECLEKILIRCPYTYVNMSELKTQELIIRTMSNDSILPSYYEILEICTNLLSSWLTYDVKTLIVDISDNKDDKIVIDRDNIYASYLTKLIIEQRSDQDDFDYTKYLTVSDNCEIIKKSSLI